MLAAGQGAVNQWTNQLSNSGDTFTGIGSTVTGSNTTTTAILLYGYPRSRVFRRR